MNPMDRLKNVYWHYIIAFLVISAAIAAHQFGLDGDLGQQFPFLLPLAAVLVAAWIGGSKPGLSAVALAAVASCFFFEQRRPGDSYEFGLLRLALFVVLSALASYLIGQTAVQKKRIAAEMHIRRQAESALREREERVRLAVESADIGTWDLNVLTGERRWSDRALAMFGLPMDENVSKLSFVDLLHPDDRPRTSRAMQSALDPRGNGRYEIDYRTLWADGTIRWVVAKGQVFFEGEGDSRRAVRFLGTVLDITERKVMEEEARSRQEVLQLAQKIGRIGHWEWNSLTDEHKWSPEIEALYGLSPGSFEGGYEAWAKLVHPEDLPKSEADVKRAFETGEYSTEFRVVWPDGSEHWLETRAKVFQDGHDGPLRLFGVDMDVTERKRLEEELRSKNRELAEADRHKDEFLATLAHELRNPLAPISDGLQVWPSLQGDHKKMEQLRSTMDRQVRQMVRLINDLMDVSRITSGKIELHKERIDLRSAIAGAVESIQSVVAAAGHQLSVCVPDEPIFVDGDAVRLTQVFGNIVNNAAKFTGRNGTISIHAENRGGQAVVTVRDNGPGIPNAMLSEIFESFRQVDATRERSQGGLGIGLMLVKRLTELHAGTVEARSEGIGRGSEFVVTLPASPAEESPPMEDAAHSQEQTSEIPRHRILIVDDLPEVAQSFRTLLETFGQEVATAHDGRSAIESILEDRPDIVFLDIAMPGMDGYEVARQLRARSELNGLTLVALTGYGQEEDRRMTADAGFDHHLTKPTSLAKLRELLLAVPCESRELC
jgi:PAS domain S-box-containing protein